MKKENIIIELNKISPELEENTFIYTTINQLIKNLNNDLKLENCKKTTKTSKINAIKRVLKNADKTNKTILKNKINIENNKMIFTDSYRAYSIKKLDAIPFETVSDDENYPNVSRIINKTSFNYDNKIVLDYADIKVFLKTHDKKDIYLLDNCELGFNPQFLIDTLDIMSDSTNYYLFENGIIGIDEINDEKCLLLGIKRY